VALEHGGERKGLWPDVAACQRCVDASLAHPTAFFEFGYCKDHHYPITSTSVMGHLLYEPAPEGFDLDNTKVSETTPATIYSAVAFGMVAVVAVHALWVAYDYPRRGPQTLLVHKVLSPLLLQLSSAVVINSML
jgi:hypothetical protein